ncbi:MAG: ABC transporter ATP-binding protein [Holosporaceae bacterium]
MQKNVKHFSSSPASVETPVEKVSQPIENMKENFQTKEVLPRNLLWWFVWKTLRPFRAWAALMLLVGACWAIDLSWRPYILKDILDQLHGPVDWSKLASLSMLYVGLTFVVALFFRLYDFAWLKLNAPLKKHVGSIVMQRMMRHSHLFYQKHASGNQGSKINDVIHNTADFVQIVLDQFFGHALAILIAIGTLWTVDAVFAAALFGWSLLFVGGTILLHKKASDLSKAYAETKASVLATVIDTLTNMMSVRFFKGFLFETLFLKRKLKTMVAARQKRDWFFLKVFTFQSLSFTLYQALCLWLLIRGFKLGHFSAGDFALILTINIAIINFLWNLSKDFAHFTEYGGLISKGLVLVYQPLDIKDKKTAVPLNVTSGKITFQNVRFQYKGAEPLFQNNSVTLFPGQKVGLVGYSGSGKTTFVNLILRLFEIKSGNILIDDQSIQQVTQASLRAQIGIIPQNPILFHRSIMDNIRYGNHEATDDEVIAAAKKAFAHSFIKKLPEGYHSLAGERGLQLSGGQRQRIAIARAILKDAPILILDEATSELDTLTESDIQKSLRAVMKNKTSLVVAHRLSTILSMDRILVFDKGNIVEDGTHQELLARDSLYKRLWDAQKDDFLPDRKTRQPASKRNAFKKPAVKGLQFT